MAEKAKTKKKAEATEEAVIPTPPKTTNPQKPSTNSVRGKQQKYAAFSDKLQREAEALLREGKQKMAAAVSKFNSEIESQRKENEAAVSKFNSGVERLQGRIRGFQKQIEEYPREVKRYSKEFWG